MTYMDEIRMQNLAAGMNKINPQPNADALSIVAVSKRGGEITGYKLSDGRLVTKQDGIEMAKSGQIRGVGVAENRGEEYLRSLPDDMEANNLGNLPVIDDTRQTLS